MKKIIKLPPYEIGAPILIIKGLNAPKTLRNNIDLKYISKYPHTWHRGCPNKTKHCPINTNINGISKQTRTAITQLFNNNLVIKMAFRHILNKNTMSTSTKTYLRR